MISLDKYADIYYNGDITNNDSFRKNHMYFEIFFDNATNAAAYAGGFTLLDDIQVEALDGDRVVVFVPWKTQYKGSFMRETMDRVGVTEVGECMTWD